MIGGKIDNICDKAFIIEIYNALHCSISLELF